MRSDRDTACDAPGSWETPSKGELLLLHLFQPLKTTKLQVNGLASTTQAAWGLAGCLGLGFGASLPEETGTNEEPSPSPTGPNLYPVEGAPALFLTGSSFQGQQI